MTRCFLLTLALSLASLAQAAGQSPAPAAPPSAPAGGELLPGDLVRLKIWREKDLSGEFLVDPDGIAVLPKLGPTRVVGVPVDSLRVRLVEQYQRYLRNPSIEITPLRRLTVLGAVRQPGVYPVDPTMTVAEALALAGGVMEEARTDRVELRRGGETIRADLRARTRIADSPVQSGDQLFVPERSWFSRNTGLVTAIMSMATSVTIALLLR